LYQSIRTLQRAVQKWAGGSGLTKTAIQHLIQTEGLKPFTWTGLPGNVYYLRRLPYCRILWVAEGSMIVELSEEGRHIKLEKGDRLEIPPGMPHQIMVGSKGMVCVEAQRRLAA
jgi:quercetin dioxygenase-like cupin family protein